MHTCATANSLFQVWPKKVGVKIITDGPLIKNDGTTWIWGLKCSMEGCFQNPGEDQTSWFWEFWREPVSDPTWTFMSCSVSYFTQFVKLTLLIYEWNSSNQMTKVKFLFHCTTYRELSLSIYWLLNEVEDGVDRWLAWPESIGNGTAHHSIFSILKNQVNVSHGENH